MQSQMNAKIRVYNTLTRKKEDFLPLNPPVVKMYVCGPTVYNLLHVGNFRGPVVYNMIRNWLNHVGYKVFFALNFTDVDDKIINKANQENILPQVLADHYIQEYKKDYQSLGLLPHDLNPKVSETMSEIQNMIARLIENKKAYVVDGDVWYSVSEFKDYGKLSGRVTDELESGVRIEVDQKKKSPHDFALWKSAKAGEPSWPSQWGPGRPGWHIECSAMVEKHLGKEIDIHGGGMDLLFPHHENEIAQSEGTHNCQFVKYWIHTNLINFSGQKMSKSLGNTVFLRDFLKEYNAEIYKMMILSVHYRSVSDFGNEAIHRAIATLGKFYSALALAEEMVQQAKAAGFPEEKWSTLTDEKWRIKEKETWLKIEEAMNDDFNSPEVFAALFDYLSFFNSQVKMGMKITDSLLAKVYHFKILFEKLSKIMAIFGEPPKQFLFDLDSRLLEKMNLQRSEVEVLVQERNQARQMKDFAKSDELRKKLADMGISISDTPQGSVWEVTK